MKVYDAIANAFVKEGTSTVFGVLGASQISWLASMGKHPDVRIVDARHEDGALCMADGWARATGKVGVCSVHQGPGVTRMVTSLVTATRSGTPLVVYTGRTAFNSDGDIQYLNTERMVEATGAGYIEVLTPDYAESAVRQAFYRARLESRPIVLCVSQDMQGKNCESDGEDYRPSTTMFKSPQRIRPDVDRLNEAIEIISGSKKPIVLLGRGGIDPKACEAADRLAKHIGALISTSLLAKGALGESEYHLGISGLFATRVATRLFNEADCVIAVGAGLNLRTTAGGYLFSNARVVQIDVVPHVLMGNENGADCYLQGDAATTLLEIEGVFAKKGVSHEGYRTTAVREALRDAHKDPAEFEIEPGTMDPREAFRVIDERLPANVGLVTGVGHCFTIAMWSMKKSRPFQLFATAFGCIGQAMATAIGVGVARNEPIVYIEGDGGAMENIQELDTASRLGVKILFIIMNDEALGAEYQKIVAMGLDKKIGMVPSPDFAAVGKAFGCRGRTARTLDELRAGVDEFLSGSGPMVLDARISRNVVSIPARRVYLGEDV